MTSLLRLLTVLSFFLGAACLAQPLQVTQDRLEIGNHMEILLDAEHVTTPAQAMQAQGWRTQGADVLHATPRGGTLWLRFTLAPAVGASEVRWLEIQNPPAAERLSYYSPATLQVYAADGTALPLAHYRNAAVRLTLPQTSPLTVYLRVDTRQTMIKHLVLWEQEAFMHANVTEEWLWGMRLGLCLLLGIVSVWFERAIRDGVYRSFSFYLFAVAFANLTAASPIRHWLIPEYVDLLNLLRFASAALLVSTVIHFALRFLGLGEQSPRMMRWFLTVLHAFTFATIGIAMAGHFETAITILAHGFIVASVAGLLFIVVHAIRHPEKVWMPFMVMVTLGGLAVLLQFLAGQGYLHVALLDYSTTLISTVVCMITFRALTLRHQRLREANDLAQQRMLQMVRESERELERQVAERTRELMMAMEEVEKALSQERAAQEEQRQFIAMVSHELRTPLAVIEAAAQNVAREESQVSSKTVQRMDKIRRATERLSSLFGQYLNNERLKMFSQTIQPGNVALLPMLEDAVNTVRPLANRHVFHIRAEQARASIRADADILRLVLGTLASNAVKYTPPGATVTLQAAPAPNGWHIDVTDNGPGVPPDEREAIFQRYYRGRASSSQPGTGLGLALARHLIERHGGTLTLLETTGGGATFRIFLPDSPAPA